MALLITGCASAVNTPKHGAENHAEVRLHYPPLLSRLVDCCVVQLWRCHFGWCYILVFLVQTSPRGTISWGDGNMAMIAVSRPACQSGNVVTAGTQPNGMQRHRCQNPACTRTIFQLAYVTHGRLPNTQGLIVERALNGSGSRDTARVRRVSPVTALRVLKQAATLTSVNTAALDARASADMGVRLARVEAAEGDERWSVVGKKQPPRWLWHA
jgi:transposase-like protein